MLTKTTHRRRAVALCGAALLLTTACEGDHGHGHTPQELSEMIAETVRDSAENGSLGLGVPDTLFDPTLYACTPAVDPELPGGWRSEAPRAVVGDSVPVELGLSDSEGERAGPVTASVTDPAGGTTTAEAALVEHEWARLSYPDAFDTASAELAPGVYTVVWSDTGTGAPIACDGFEVE